MEPKFIQAKGLYENNEYPNMPSIGYMGRERLTTKNQSNIDWGKVGEIVKKYGLGYCIINDTFGYYGEDGVYQSEFVLYFKTFLTSDWYESRMKEKDYDAIRQWEDVYSIYPQLLHDCVHELDEQTELYFETGWAGNVGVFGSHDVKRKTYSFGDRFHSWSYITDRWSPSIHDTTSKLKKGVYLFMTSRHLADKTLNP